MKATDKPLTLQECKDKVAKDQMYKDFDHYADTNNIGDILDLIDEAAELYKDSTLEAHKNELASLKAFEANILPLYEDRTNEIKAQKEEIEKLQTKVQYWESGDAQKTIDNQVKEIEALKQQLEIDRQSK